MNKNDPKSTRSPKGLIDPNKTKTFLVYHKTNLLTFLREKIPHQSQHNIRHIIANHQVAVGGAPVSLFTFPLYPEDEVTVSYNKITKRERKDLPIIYEDEDIIAINKPSGLLSVASDREKGRTAYRIVSDYLTQKDKNARIFVVHRLDEDTSGVLIFAKKYEVRETLQNHWQEIVSKRGYYAIVEPGDISDSGRLVDYLAQDKALNVFVTKNKKAGKEAITNYRKIVSTSRYALLDVNIETGRKNQIRVQLGNIGHYVIGDDRYGEPSNPLKRLGLHAYELDFLSPVTKKVYKINCPIPPEFKKLLGEGKKDNHTVNKSKKTENGTKRRT